MNLGPLDKRARIERKVSTLDPDYGTQVDSWEPITNPVVWCSVQDELPSKSEAVRNGLTVATQRTRIRMRYRSDITSDMRIIIARPAAQAYQIVSGPAVLGRNGIELFVERYSS